jgi:hypothetical protein
VGFSRSSKAATGARKVAAVGQAVRTDGPQVRQAERRAVAFADIAAHRAGDLDAEADAAGDHHDLARRDVEAAELGDQMQVALLRHDQQLAVGVLEHPVDHRAVGQVEVRGHAGLGGHVAVAADRDQAVDEVGRLGRDLQRIPAQAVGRRRGGVERAALQLVLGVGRIGPVAGAGPQAVEPAAAVLVARRGEGRARQLLGIEPERRRLRRVLAHRQRAGHGLAGEVVAEAGLVLERVGHADLTNFLTSAHPSGISSGTARYASIETV